jgi:hypothetical protein
VRGGKRPGAGRKRTNHTGHPDMNRGLDIVLQLLSSDEISDEDAGFLASLWSFGMRVYDGEGRRLRSRHPDKRRLAFMSYALCAIYHETYPKDWLAIDKVVEMHNVSPRTVKTARSIYPADSQRISVVQEVVVAADPITRELLVKHIQEISASRGPDYF